MIEYAKRGRNRSITWRKAVLDSLLFIRINADLTKKKTQRKKRIHIDDTN